MKITPEHTFTGDLYQFVREIYGIECGKTALDRPSVVHDKKIGIAVCLMLISMILFATTRCRIQELAPALSFLAWIYVGNILWIVEECIFEKVYGYRLPDYFPSLREIRGMNWFVIACGCGTSILGTVYACKELYQIFIACP